MSPRILPVLALVVGLTLSACGSDDAGDAPGAAAGPSVIPSPSPAPTLPAAQAQPGKKAKGTVDAAPSVAPEVVVPSTSDSRSSFAPGDWQGAVVAALARIDPRLATDQVATIKKVRATCRQMETGMFETKVVPIIRKRFSTPQLAVTSDMAEDIYSVLLGDACYTMVESP